MSRRARMRREQRATTRLHGGSGRGGSWPMVPGVIPDRSQVSLDVALAQAHEELPNIPGTQVCVNVFDSIAAGIDALAAIYPPDQLQLLAEHAARVGGTDPTIVVGYRRPHDHQERVGPPDHCGHVGRAEMFVATLDRVVDAGELGVTFICTLPSAHGGVHVAQGPDGVECARWQE